MFMFKDKKNNSDAVRLQVICLSPAVLCEYGVSLTHLGTGTVLLKLILAAALVLMAGGVQAVTLDVVGAQLMGASNVLVDGSLYDVQFVDGSCIDVFNGCDDVSDFTFQSQAVASLASQALVDQVLDYDI
jgi:hypothetical protein